MGQRDTNCGLGVLGLSALGLLVEDKCSTSLAAVSGQVHCRSSITNLMTHLRNLESGERILFSKLEDFMQSRQLDLTGSVARLPLLPGLLSEASRAQFLSAACCPA